MAANPSRTPRAKRPANKLMSGRLLLSKRQEAKIIARRKAAKKKKSKTGHK